MESTLTYSPNTSVNAVIAELLVLGVPPIPVAPKHRSNAGFTGKNPSYLDSNNRHRFVKHGQYQHRLPSSEELTEFFQHQDVGIGVLGGVNGVHWLDLDRKHYPSQSDCDRAFDAIVERICTITGCTRAKLWIEQTGSGGYRLPVVPTEQPDFTNFTTTEGGERVGECLGKGRFAVLAPTVHPSGNSYRRLEFGQPATIPNLASIGIFPAKDELEQRERRQRRRGNYTPPVASFPGDNAWDIRNFAQYFEGYTERGNGWGYAQCPHHDNATSQTSFRVNLHTGQFKAWCGCDTKAVYRSGLDLAISHGYQLPEKKEPQRDRKQPGEISRERWDEKQLYKRIAQLFGRASKRRLNRDTNSPPGSELEKQESNSLPGNELVNTECSAIVLRGQLPPEKWEYERGNLPAFEEWQAMGRPLVEFKQGDRVALDMEAIAKGYPATLDRSMTGLQKSTHAAQLGKEYLALYSEPNEKGRQPKAWYLSNGHRNPSTEGIELRAEDLIARHDGLVYDTTRKTALGNNFVTRRQPGQTPDIAPSCIQTEVFNSAAAKGHQQFAGKDSPICNQCPQFYSCHYLQERERQNEKVRFLRSAVDAAPIGGEDLAIVEEAQHEVKGTKEVEIGLDTLAKEAFYLSTHHSDLYRHAYPAIAAIHKAVFESLEASEHNRYGFSHVEILQRLPGKQDLLEEIWNETPNADPWDLPTLAEISKQLLQALAPDWEELFAGVTDPAQRTQIVRDRVATAYSVKLLRIIDGRDRSTDLRIANGKLIISRRNHDQQRKLKKARFIKFLDATANTKDLAKSAGMSPADILPCRQQRPDCSNLTIKVVKGMGRIGSQRRGKRSGNQNAPVSPYEAQQRVNACVVAIAEQHDGTGAIFDRKGFLPEYEGIGLLNGAHFRDNRGRNSYSDCSYLISVGKPTSNLGQQLAEWHCLGGKPTTLANAPAAFCAKVQRQQVAETVQTIGRLRAHLAPEQPKTAYIIDDLGEDAIAAIAEQFPGCKVEEVDIYDICKAAAPKGVQHKRGLIEALWGAISTGNADPKLDAIAAAVGIKKAHASSTLKTATGQGFRRLKKKFVFAI